VYGMYVCGMCMWCVFGVCAHCGAYVCVCVVCMYVVCVCEVCMMCVGGLESGGALNLHNCKMNFDIWELIIQTEKI